MKINHKHPFHLVDPSPWPFAASFAGLFTTFGMVLYIHGYESGLRLWSLGLFLLIFVSSLWRRDVIREATYEGHHTRRVQKGLRLGISLFIVSEVIFFWAFFHSSLSPVFTIGGVWPPVGIEPINPWGVPFLNTGMVFIHLRLLHKDGSTHLGQKHLRWAFILIFMLIIYLLSLLYLHY